MRPSRGRKQTAMDALPSQERWDKIARYLDVHTGAAPSDAAFILGTRFPDPAHLAAELFRQGLISRVIATGGINRQTGRVESHRHREILLESSVPLDRVLVETASTALKRHLPRGTRYHVATYELPGLTRETWHMTPQGRETVLSNWPKIPRYLAQGHLEDIQVSSSGCE